jgi:hypothetical protein
VEEILARHGRSMVVPGGYGIWTQCVEGVLEVGEAVAVLGRVGMETDPDPHASGGGYRGRAMRPVLIDLGPHEPMVISDDPDALRS